MSIPHAFQMGDMMDDSRVRLRGTGDIINVRALPEPLLQAIGLAIEREPDPYITISGYAYMICGLRIRDIREMFILSDRSKFRKASREYVRQKVVSFYIRVKHCFEELHGESLLAPLYRDEATNYEVADLFRSDLARMEEEHEIPTEEEEEAGKAGSKRGKTQGKKPENAPEDTSRRSLGTPDHPGD